MNRYKIIDIESIGPVYAKKFHTAGIHSVNNLLKQGATREGRKKLQKATGINSSHILKWVNMADLYRIKGVGSEYSSLLEKAGVDSVKELRKREPQNLFTKMKQVNSAARPIVRQLPGLKTVRKWVSHAKRLDPKITY